MSGTGSTRRSWSCSRICYRGTAASKSDYDLLVFLDRSEAEVEVPRLMELGWALSSEHRLGPLSLSPLTREQFLALDAKYDGIIQRFREDAVDLLPFRRDVLP